MRTPPSPKQPLHGFIYLASQSPRRAQLLDLLGVANRPLQPGPEEDAESLEAERPGELPAQYVQRVTLAKLQAARQRCAQRALPTAPILCADTTVALGRRILGKPADADAAALMLSALSGKAHRVLTCVALAVPVSGKPGAPGSPMRALKKLSISHVRFAPLPADTISRYVASGEPFGKAGAYAIQGALAGWIEHIQGSHSGIMGLPMFETNTLLHQANVAVAL
jgi:septum formation protein